MNGCQDKQTKQSQRKWTLKLCCHTKRMECVCVCVCANEKGKSKKRVQRCLPSFIHPQLQLCSGIYCQLVTHTQFAETIKICLSVKWKKVCQFVCNPRQTETETETDSSSSSSGRWWLPRLPRAIHLNESRWWPKKMASLSPVSVCPHVPTDTVWTSSSALPQSSS